MIEQEVYGPPGMTIDPAKLAQARERLVQQRLAQGLPAEIEVEPEEEFEPGRVVITNDLDVAAIVARADEQASAAPPPMEPIQTVTREQLVRVLVRIEQGRPDDMARFRAMGGGMGLLLDERKAAERDADFILLLLRDEAGR